MATNIDKALYQAPMGLDDMGEEAIEIEIVDPESVKIGIDGMEIEIDPDAMSEEDFSANLAEEMTEGALQTLSSDLTSEIDNDKAGHVLALSNIIACNFIFKEFLCCTVANTAALHSFNCSNNIRF